MGLFKKSKERKAFETILKKKTTQAARKSYADEAVKVATERAKAKARRKTFGEVLGERVRGKVQSIASGRKSTRRISVKRAFPKRKKSTRRTVRRASPRRTVRRTVRKASPRRTVRRTRRTKSTTQPIVQQQGSVVDSFYQ